MISTARNKGKFKKLIRLLRDALPALPIDIETIAIGMLERLWHATANDAFRGDIGKLTNDEIAESIGWFGNADLIVSILVATRWLDVSDQFRLVVHDWHEHAPTWVKGNALKYGGFVTGTSSKEPPIGDSPKEPPQGSLLPSQAKPSLSKPSLANPIQSNSASQAKPSQVNQVEAGELAGRQAGFDFLALAGEEKARDAIRQAKALATAFGGTLGTSQEVWEIAWIGLSCRPGFVPEIIERFKSLKGTDRKVKAPKRWLHGALRKELPAGVSFEDAMDFTREQFKEQLA